MFLWHLVSRALKWSSLAVLQDISSPPWRETNITETLACFLSSPRRRRKLPAAELSTLHLRMMEEKESRGEQNGGGDRGAVFAAPLCPRISLCNLCNRMGDDDTISPQNDCQLGTSVIDAHSTNRGETLTDSSPTLVNLQPFSSIWLPKAKPIRVADT